MGVNLQAAIEMIDYGLSSTASASSVETSRTTVDTEHYDGATYYFEIVASNSNTNSAYLVGLADSTGSIKASIPLPPSTTLARFQSAAFVPNLGASAYWVRMPETAASGNVVVRAARIVIDQMGATKTRLQIPLAASSSISGSVDGSYIASTSNTAYGQYDTPDKFVLFYRDANAYDGILDWTFEVMARASVSSTGSYSLFRTDGAQVLASEITNSSTSIQTLSATIAPGDAQFTSGSEYEVRWKSSSSARAQYLYKARLYVRIKDFSKAESYFRLLRQTGSSGGAGTIPHQRLVLETAKFSLPEVYHEATGSDVTLGAITQSLFDTGTSDSSETGTAVAGSAIDFPSTTKSRQRAGPFTVTSGNRFIWSHDGGGGTHKSASDFVVIKANRP